MKRCLLIVVVFLLAGLAVNVAVAWGCAVTADPDTSITEFFVAERIEGPEIENFWSVEKGAGIGVQRIAYTRTSRQNKMETVVHRDRRPGVSVQDPLACPSWAPWPPEPRPAIRESVVHLAVGFPLQCLHASNPVVPCRFRTTTGARLRQVAPASWKHALVPPNGPFAGDVLPCHPIWPGFAVNTLFYAVMLWLLICGALALHRFIRVRRSLCPACAYPRGESAVCTECGGALPARERAST